MSSIMTRVAWEQMVDENIAALKGNIPEGLRLEFDHSVMCLEWMRENKPLVDMGKEAATKVKAQLTAAAEEIARYKKALELTDDMKIILGKPNFWCASIARELRKYLGYEIEEKAEKEQAAVIHWLLTHYLKSGPEWAQTASDEMKAGKAALSNGGG